MNLIATTLNRYEGMFDILLGVRERGIDGLNILAGYQHLLLN